QSPRLSEVRAFIKIEAPVLALTQVRVIDGTGAPAREDQTIIISGGKILSVGDSTKIKTPSDAKVMEMTGKTVLPGLVGMHNHLYYPTPPAGLATYGVHGFSFPRLYLAGGVTSMRTTGGFHTYTDLEIKKKIDAGALIGPKMHITGPYFEGPDAAVIELHQI